MTPFERAQRYLEKVPGVINGERGCHSRTFKTAITIVQGYNLSDEETALQLLRDWNRKKCDPPWSEYELRHKVPHALRAGSRRERGWLLGASARLTPELSDTARPRAPAPKPWPEPDLALIDRVVTDGITSYDVCGKSPTQSGDNPSHPKEKRHDQTRIG